VFLLGILYLNEKKKISKFIKKVMTFFFSLTLVKVKPKPNRFLEKNLKG